MIASTPDAILRDVFGLSGFRTGQAEVVAAQLAGRDVLSVAPTGSGKSISYWIPALATGGLTLVVSPLIALMKDQVDRLQALGVAAGFINSSIDRELQVRQLEAAEAGEVVLLYLAPERLSRPGFLDRLARLPVTRIVVDEAHCISTWGHDFRPDYRLLGRAVAACGRPPIAAFTATATPKVREDVAAILGLQDPLISVTGFQRPNLTLRVEHCRGDTAKRETLLTILRPGIGRVLVYSGTVGAAEELALLLSERGVNAAAYHGRLEEGRRRQVQDDFAGGKVDVVVATSAFGMGVDVADVRQVIHFHLPGSIESYYQEAGRAGRDGAPAECVLLYSAQDRDLQSFFIEQGDATPALREYGYSRLAQMVAYAHLATCRHARIAAHFGEVDVAPTCQACDNCLAGDVPTRLVPADEVRGVLFGSERLSGRIGAANLAGILRGASSTWTRRNPWTEELSAFGILRSWPDEAVRDLLRQMVEAGLFEQSHGEYPVLGLTTDGREVARGQRDVEIRLRLRGRAAAQKTRARVRSGSDRGGSSADEGLGAGAAELLERLRAWRTGLARESGMPPYVIFHDATLRLIATAQPRSQSDLARIAGIGPAKLERYGDSLLELIRTA